MTHSKNTAPYTTTELMEACRAHIARASEVYQEANRAVSRRLKNEGISPDEFVKYCREYDTVKTTANALK